MRRTIIVAVVVVVVTATCSSVPITGIIITASSSVDAVSLLFLIILFNEIR